MVKKAKEAKEAKEAKGDIISDQNQGSPTGLGSSDSQNNVAFEAFKFSNKFLCSKAKISSEGLTAGDYISKITTKNPKEKLNLMSDIFKNITSVPKYEDGFKQYIEHRNGLTVIKGGIGDYIIEVVKKHYGISDPSCASDNEQEISDKKYLLYIKGPVGCYKNRLLEYVYLTLCADEKLKDVPIFYINFTKYEGNTTLIDGDISSISAILNKNKESKPLFILEGIRGFYFGQNKTIYNPYVEFLGNKYKIIASRDIDFAQLNTNRISLPFGGDQAYLNALRISSLNINRQYESRDFIKNCKNIFDDMYKNEIYHRIYESFDIENFYRKLKQQYIYTLDAYQLIKIFKNIFITRTNVSEGEETILQIYDRWIQDFNSPIEVYEQAYNYEYKDVLIDFHYDENWFKIIKHKSILEYYISMYYNSLLEAQLRLQESEWQYNLPNVVFPKSITRFIVSRRHQKLVSYTYNYCISQWTNTGALSNLLYLCGRNVNNDDINNVKSKLNDILIFLNEQLIDNINSGIVFLLRTTFVSLIYLGDSQAAESYFKNLISSADNIHSKINVGFHMVYYGDTIQSLKENDSLCYENIEVDKCLNTLRALTIDLSQDFTATSPSRPLVTILQLITYCQILERRDFELRGIGTQSEDFLGNLCTWLQTITDKQLFVDMTEVRSYFQKMLNLVKKQQLIKRLDVQEATNVMKYNTYSQLYTIGRTGWIMRGIKEGYKKTGDEWKKSVYTAESVAEHTLNSWLLGYIFLPQNGNKQKILELLLVHDFAEVCTGDIVQKNDMQREEEKRYMQDFLGERKAIYKAWCDVWGSTGKDNTLKVARDIDRIQAVYQYFRYYCATKTREKVIESDGQNVQEWLSELDKLTTDLGKNIAKCVILCNAVFLEQSELIDKFSAVLKKMFPSDSRQ